MSETIQFGGKWRLFNDTKWYDGTLYVETEKRYLFLEIILPSKDEEPAPTLNYVGKVPFVNGILYNNAKVLLYDCRIDFGTVHYNQYSEQGIYPKYCFMGLSVEKEEDLQFSRVEFDFGEIIEWSTLCKYNWDWTNRDNPAVTWDKKPSVSFQLREGVEVTFRPLNSFRLFPSFDVKTTITQQVLIEIQYHTPIVWTSIMNDALSLRYLVGLGMNRFVGIESAHYYHESLIEYIPSENGLIKKPLSMEVWFGNHDAVHTSAGNPYEYSYNFTECQDYNIIQNWNSYYSKLKPVLDLYFSSGRYEVYVPEIVFLNLMQALETYHARFVADTKNDYIKHVEQMLDAIFHDGKDASNWKGRLLGYDQWKDKLISSDQKEPWRKTVLLISRLNDLIFADGEICWWSFDNGKHEDFAKKLVDTRNYYTHYDEKKKDKAYSEEELPYVNQHLRCLLNYHLLTKLGYDKQKAKEKVTETRSRINTSYKLFTKTNEIKEVTEEKES